MSGTDKKRKIELLAPAKDADTAIEAILHGADAVYMGPPSHGARKNASNTLDDFKRVIETAHPFRARVYATVNTLVYEKELASVERLITDLYRIGVDAIIVQDMGILRLDIPPIALHASTQCDIRTIEKAIFLEKVGFSQLVLPRELTLPEIREFCSKVTVPVECFIHGALCVSYSGRCGISQACLGRSANRGECAQFCRMPYTLADSGGKVLARDKYLLSLKDFNATPLVADLMDAGVSSFKIEGRLKDIPYVKNITAWYRQLIDGIISRNPGRYERSSFGESEISFTPVPAKSFNRGFTHYFLDGTRPRDIASLATNKSLGEPIKDVKELHNGDGISWFDKSGKYTGAHLNLATSIPKEALGASLIYRTSDVEFDKQLSRPTAVRKIPVTITIDEEGATVSDSRSLSARVPLDCKKDKARKPMNPAAVLSKLGDTIYRAEEVVNNLSPDTFIPSSMLAALRRRLITALGHASAATYPYDYRRREDKEAPYPARSLKSADNVANSLSRKFYEEHGVEEIPAALEVAGKGESPLMICRHCVLRELGKCRKENPDASLRYPLVLTTGPHRFRVEFDCAECRMKIYREGSD